MSLVLPSLLPSLLLTAAELALAPAPADVALYEPGCPARATGEDLLGTDTACMAGWDLHPPLPAKSNAFW